MKGTSVAIDEQIRHELFTGLQAAVGLKPAKLMMTAIPPFSWSEIATKADLAEFATRNEMRVEFAEVRSEMKFEFAAVRGEMQAEFAAVRSEMHADSAAIRLETANSFNRMLEQMTKNFQNLFFQIAAFNISTAGIVIAAVHYLG